MTLVVAPVFFFFEHSSESETMCVNFFEHKWVSQLCYDI